MRKTLLKQMTLALLLTVAVPYAKSQVAHVGDILCTTGVYVSPAEYEASGLEAMAVIFYVDATGLHGWAVALEDEGYFIWSSYSLYGPTPLPAFSSSRAAIYDLNGQFNTQEVLSYGSDHNYSYPAFEALDVANGWYLPALGQLNYLYGNLVEVNAGLNAAGGSVFNMTGSWCYWSSTKTDSHVWFLKESGSLNSTGYTVEYRVRGVRNF